MTDQYVATDSRTGLQVTITGAFPEDPDDRIRIARTCTLFTRLFATILSMDDAKARREGFKAVETQLEVADALMKRDLPEVQRLIQETMISMGITEEQLREVEEQLRRHLQDIDGEDDPPFDLPDGRPTGDW